MGPRFLLAALIALRVGAALAAEPPRPSRARAILDDPNKTVTLDVQGAKLNDALRMLAKPYHLSIITARNVDAVITASFQNVTLKEALESLVTINGFAYRVKGGVIEVYAPSAGEGVTVEKPRLQTFELKFANAEKFKALLTAFLTKGIGKIEAETGRNVLIVYDLPPALEAISQLLAKVDRPEPQVTIGAEIIEAGLDVARNTGISWRTRIALTGAARPTSFPFPISSSCAFNPTVDPDEGASGDSFPYVTRDDFVFGTLDATGLRVVLDILKTDDRANLIANPEITTLNNHEAKIKIGDTVPVPIYTTNLETGVSAVTGFEDVETGTILTVTPQVNDDGSVTLKVKPEISEILGFKGQFDERPIVASRTAETTVRLQNGETLVIGGLVSEKLEESRTKFPLLGDLPLVGWLFRSKSLTREKSTLYIFVTPRVVTGNVPRIRARNAADRLIKNGLDTRQTGSDDLRNEDASPFKAAAPGPSQG